MKSSRRSATPQPLNFDSPPTSPHHLQCFGVPAIVRSRPQSVRSAPRLPTPLLTTLLTNACRSRMESTIRPRLCSVCVVYIYKLYRTHTTVLRFCLTHCDTTQLGFLHRDSVDRIELQEVPHRIAVLLVLNVVTL